MSTGTHTVLFEDTFAHGDALSTDWQLMRLGDFAADDGVVVTGSQGLSVSPPGRHPDTGEPAFTKAIAGINGHLKWLAVTASTFPTDDGALRVSFRAGARTFGMADHPFGADVDDPLTDLRLGAGTIHVLDFQSGMVFDFWITENAIYPYYERIRLPGLHGDHEAFGSIVGPVPRRGSDDHDLAIVIDGRARTARWEVDGVVVARVDNVGPTDPSWQRVLYHGGETGPVQVGRVQVGLGLLTLLDAALGDPDRGLLDLGLDYSPTRTFHGGPHVWGQGAELRVRRVVVERT